MHIQLVFVCLFVLKLLTEKTKKKKNDTMDSCTESKTWDVEKATQA